MNNTKVVKVSGLQWKVTLEDYRVNSKAQNGLYLVISSYILGGYIFGLMMGVFQELFPELRPYSATFHCFHLVEYNFHCNII